MHTSEPRVRLPELTSEQCTVLAATARDALDKLPVNRRAAADAEVDAEQWKVIEPVLRPLDNKHTALTNLVFTFARTLALYANRRSTPDTQSVVTAIRIACGISPQEPVWEEYLRFIDAIGRLPSHRQSSRSASDNFDPTEVTRARRLYESSLVSYAARLT